MANVFPLRSTFSRALIVLSASALFACTVGSGTGDPPDVVIVAEDIFARPTPLPSFDVADFRRDMLAFADLTLFERFPLALTVLPFDPSQPLGAVGPGRCTVTPGRASCARQTVPARSRRKLRTWERDAAV